MEDLHLRSHSEAETIQIGQQFADRLRVGDVVALEGDLGAGKTEFVKGVCEYFSVDDLVTSPTFTIINQYAGTTLDGEPLKIYHVDMVFAHDAIKLIEWPEKAASLMPTRRWDVRITADEHNDDLRHIVITAPVATELA
jgi:tRNA threonylcarbamoyladenosine biosynthesis protein TsaE